MMKVYADKALLAPTAKKDDSTDDVDDIDIFASVAGGQDEDVEAIVARRALREAEQEDEEVKTAKEHRKREEYLEVSRILTRIDRHMRATSDGLRYCKNDPRMIRVKQGVL